MYTKSCKTLQLRRNLHHYCAAQTHENIRIERQASDIFCSIRWTRSSCDSRQLYDSKWTLRSSVTCISKKIYETRTDEWHAAWINPRAPSLGVDTERDFLPVVSSFHQTYKANKRRSFILVPDGHYSHTTNLEVIILARENHVDIFASHLTTGTKYSAWIKLSWGPWKHSTSKKLKFSSVRT